MRTKRIHSKKAYGSANVKLLRENRRLLAIVEAQRNKLKENEELLYLGDKNTAALAEATDILAEAAGFLKIQDQLIKEMEETIDERDKEIAALKAKLSRKANK